MVETTNAPKPVDTASDGPLAELALEYIATKLAFVNLLPGVLANTDPVDAEAVYEWAYSCEQWPVPRTEDGGYYEEAFAGAVNARSDEIEGQILSVLAALFARRAASFRVAWT